MAQEQRSRSPTPDSTSTARDSAEHRAGATKARAYSPPNDEHNESQEGEDPGPTLIRRLSHFSVKSLSKEPNENTLKVRPWRLQTTPFEQILEYEYSGKGTLASPYVVQFLPKDAENPMLFTNFKMWTILALVSVNTLSVAFASSLFTGGAEGIIREFRCSQEVFILGLSFFVLGFAIGPLFWAPFSEMFGRRSAFLISYSMFTLWNGVAAASPNIGALIAFRFLAGAFGSSPLVNSGGTIADMFPASKRALAMSIFSACPFLGPTLGPSIGGFLGAVGPNGWRYNQYLLCGFAGILTIISAFFLPETYGPRLLRQRAFRLSTFTGKVYRAPPDVKKELELVQLFKTSMIRPWQLLFREPVVFLISIYMAIVYGTLYMFFSAFPIVFQEGRGWSPGIGGLAFIGIMVGMFFGVSYIILYDNPRYIRVADKNHGAAPPEERLPCSMTGGVALVVGLAMFAGTNSPSVFWLVPIIASSFFGFGMLLVFVALSNYLVDSYLIFAASVLAANSVLRSIFGAVFPLFTSQMYHNLGIHWATAVPGFLALACLPCPFLFYKYGARIRKRCKYSAQAAKMWEDMVTRRKTQREEEDDVAPQKKSENTKQNEKPKQEV